MAAILVGLRLRQLGRALTRSAWAIATLVLTAIAALSMLAMLAAAVVALRIAAPDGGLDAMVILAAVLVAGWAVGAVVVGGDDALAPERFSLLPVRPARLLPAVLLAGAVGVGGAASLLALGTGLIGWSADPGALVAAILTMPLVLATCVLAGRTVAGVAGRALARRRTRDLVLVLTTLVLIGSGLLLQVVLRGIAALGSSALGVVADVLAWTPLAAAWGVPHAIAEGRPLVAAAQLAIALATLAALWWAWARSFTARLTAPIASSGGGEVHGGGFVDRLLPASPAGAIAARGIRYRFRDPRHIVNLLGCAVLPLVVVGAGALGGDGLSPAVAFAPLLVAVVLMTVVQLDTAYDKDAVALHVLAGVRGADDRAGRLLGMGVLTLPILVVACIACAALPGRLDLLPATLGATLGLALVVAGVGTAISPWMPGQAPAPEASPFGRGSSGGAEALLGMLAMTAGGLVLAGPALAAAVASLWLPWLGWVSLGLGLGVGALVLWAGVVVGGRGLDRRWPELLAAVSREG